MRSLPHNTLVTFPVQIGLSRVSFYDQATVTRLVSGLPHGGVDFGSIEGTPIKSATNGRVPLELVIGGDRVPGCGWRHNSGNYAVIVDDGGFFFYYFHLQSPPLLQVGARVVAGQFIGFMGNSGLEQRSSDAPVHLHFQSVNTLHHLPASVEWYEHLSFPVRNLNNLDPFDELARLAQALPNVRRGGSEVQGIYRRGFRIG